MELSQRSDVSETVRLIQREKGHDWNRSKRIHRRKASRWRKLAVMAAGLIQQFVTIGLGFGLTVMYPELIATFNAKRSNVAVIQGLYLGLTTGAGIIWTGIIKRVGPGPTIIVGALVSAVGFFASSFAQDLQTIIALVGFMAGMGMCTCYLSAFIAVSWMFHEDPGFPLVCLTIGSSLGQFTIPLLYETFIVNYGWSGAFMLVSGLALQCLPCGVILYTSREYYVTDDNKSDDVISEESITDTRSVCSGYATLLKDYLLWILLLDFLLIASTGNVESWFMVDIMTSRGLPRETGAVLVSTIGFANFIGRILGSTLRFKCNKIPTVYHWIWICPIIAGGHALIVNLTDYWPLFGACIMQGIAFGMNNAQTPAVMVEASGLARYPQAMSLVNLMYGFGNLTSNLMGGSIKDIFGDYDIVYYIAVGVSLFVTLNSIIASCIIQHRSTRRYSLEKKGSSSVKYQRGEKTNT